MRRTLFASCICVLLLAGCVQQSAVPPQTVMERAAAASASLQSVRFAVKAHIKTGMPGGTIDANVDAKGVTQEHGSTVQIEARIQGTMQTDMARIFDTQFDMIADQNGDSYFLLKGLQMTPEHPLFPTQMIQPLLNQWWRFKHASGSPISVGMTPDPHLIDVQAQVVRVTADHGIERLNGTNAYHYDVTLDPQKLMTYLRKVASDGNKPFDEKKVQADLAGYAAAGQLWIDAQNYELLRVQWDIHPNDAGDAQKTILMLQMDLTDHNAAPPIVIPTTAHDLPGGFPRGSSLTGTASLLPVVPASQDPTVLDALRRLSGTSGKTLPPAAPSSPHAP